MKKSYGLTFPQKNIWLVDRVNHNTPINVIVGIINIKNGFREDVCDKAINKFIEENEGIRLKLKLDGEEPIQYVSDYKYKKIEDVDLSESSKEQISDFLSGNALHPFSLLEDDLYDFKIVRTGDDSGLIFIKLHHMVCDAWSYSQLGKQIMENYEKIINGMDLEEKVVPSYIEFIETEREYSKSEKCTKDKEFFEEYLRDLKDPVSLKEAISNTTSASRKSFILSDEENEKINKYCKDNKVSPYAFFLAALSTYIYRIKDVKDFVIGTPVLNRSGFKEKQMLGMFVSTLPLRIRIEENEKFLDVIKNISRDTMSLFRHQRYPYSKTLEYVHKNTDIKTNLFNLSLSYQNARIDLPNEDRFSTDWIFNENISDQLQIHIMDMDSTGKLNIHYDYLKELFLDEEIGYIHTRLMSIIYNAIDDIDVDVEKIRIMSVEEENRILYDFNNTKVDYPKDKTVIDLFEEQVKKNSDKVALVFENKTMTYGELNKRANQVAWYLKKEKGIKENEFVALLLDRGFDMLVAILGVLKSGAAYIPIDKNFPIDRIEYMLLDSNSKILITESNDYDFKIDIMNIHDLYQMEISDNLTIKRNQDELAYMIYTSGTTGKPKGCQIRNSSLLNLIFSAIDLQGLQSFDSFACFSTYSFDISILETILPLIIGARVVIANNEEQKLPNLMCNLIKNNSVQVINMTPTRMGLILDFCNDDDLVSLERIMLGGEVFPKEFYNKLKNKCNAKIYDGYGPTEITVWSSAKLILNEDDINIGRSLNNVTAYILDRKNRLLPVLVEGELCIGGAGVAVGYYGNNKLTNEKFINFMGDRIYKTGDLSCYNNVGELQYFGRIDSQIKLRGLRIEIGEIESVIKEQEGIIQVAVTVNKDEQLCAYFTANKKIDVFELKSNIRKVLPEYMIPKKYLQIDKFNLNVLGKIDKKDLPIIEETSDLDNADIEKPQNKIQKELVNIFLKILNIKKFGINTDLSLFNIDSLELIRINMEILDKFGIELSIKDLSLCSNIKEIEELIEKTKINSYGAKELNNKEVKLTPSQFSIFSEYSMDTDSTQYNIPFEISILKDDIDVNKLKISIEEVIRNNKLLFTKIYFNDSNIYQKIDENLDYEIRIIDNISEAEYLEYRKDFVKPFDVLNDRLFNIEMCITDKKIYVLFDFNHIIFDGTSASILLNEISKMYNENNIEFKNVSIDILNNSTGDKKYNYAKEFFNDKFKGELPSNTIIGDFERPLNKSYEGCNYTINIDEKLSKNILKYSSDNNVTLSSIFLSVYEILLSKYMYSEDIIIGLATSGRYKKEQLNIVGMFEKTIPFRMQIDTKYKVLDFIEKVQQSVFEYIDNSMYSIDKLVSDLKIKRNPSRHPLFDVVFAYQNFGIKNLWLNGKEADINPISASTSKFDLTCEVIPNNKQFKINFEYCTKLFKEETIMRLGRHYINILEQIVSYNSIDIKDIEMITKEEKNKILNEFNDTTTDYPRDKTVIEFFEENVAKFPDKKAIICNGYYLTYKQLNEKCNKLANYLIKRGVKNQEVVGILMDRSVEFYIAMIAVLKCNAIFTTVIEDIPDERAKYMFDNASVNKVITTKKFDRKKLEYEKILIDLDNEIYVNESEENLAIRGKATDIVHVIYTSGTTGLPKGNMITNRGMIRLIVNTNFIVFGNEDISITTSSLTFDSSTFENYCNLIFGMTWHVFTKEQVMNFDLFRRYIRDNGITTIFVPTPIFNQMLEYDSTIFDTLKSVYVGGDNFLLKNANIVYNKPYEIYNMYGPAENSVMTTYYRISKIHTTRIPIGYLNSNSNGYIYDKCGKLCPINVPGDLYVGGDGLAVGYINKPELTKEKFVYVDELGKRVYKTGDLTLWNSDGSIQFLGRIDSQIKIRGQRIELLEIQNKMLELPQLKEVAIKCFEDNKKNKYLVAYYTSNAEISEHNIKEFLNKYLPSYMIPSRIIMLNEMPLNQNGKIDYKKLPEVKLKNNEDLILPKNKEQEKILNVFKYTLAREDIGMNSDYFENGGDSLSVVNLISQFKNVGIDILYADIFKYKKPIDIYNYLYEEEEQTSISENIKDFDYSKINKLIVKNKNVEFDTKQIGNVLLTGVTGFLGVHVLEELVESGIEKVYCLIRNKNDINITERFDKHLKFFFSKAKVEKIKERTVLINGDLTKDNILADSLEDLDITTVINCAARVAHYGDLAKFEEINVDGVNNLIKYCLENNKELIHISTLSVSGNLLEGGQIIQKNIKDGTIFDETKLFVGQDLDNVYVYTKYMAEKNILDNIVNNGLNAKIIRVGNLTGRYRDGKFQPNVEENAFSGRIKSIIKLRVIPENLLNLYLEMTPIDYAAKAIVKLSKITSENTIFHLFNDNHAYVPFVMDCFKDLGIDLKIISKKEMKNILDKEIKENIDKVSGLISDIGKSGMLEYNTNITVKSEITKQILEKLQFKWPKVTTEYFKKYINYLKDIGYIEF